MELKVTPFDIEAGGKYIVVLNEGWANHNGIFAGDRVKISKGEKELVGIVDTSDTSIREDEIGIFEEIERKYGFEKGDIVNVKRLEETYSARYIREKLEGKRLSSTKIYQIIEEIVQHRLSNVEISALACSAMTRAWNLQEIVDLTNAIVETGEQIQWATSPIANKHSIGGVPGNRTTGIIVPIIAAAGYKIPKTSSRAITSPAGTADTMEVLANVEYRSKELKNIVYQTNGCFVWGGGIDLVPADSEILKVCNPLKIDPEPLMITSIMSKKKATGTTHLLIDIPYGKQSKVKTKQKAKELKKKFEKVGEKVNIKVRIVFTDGTEPIGNGIGPLLEIRDVLMILERKKKRPLDLEKKSLRLARGLLDLLGVKEEKRKVKEILENKKALKKFKEIIAAQDGDPNITSKDLKPAKKRFSLKAKKNGRIKHIDNIYVSEIARRLGCPGVKKSGVYLHKHTENEVRKGDPLITFYSNNKEDLNDAIEYAQKNPPISVT